MIEKLRCLVGFCKEAKIIAWCDLPDDEEPDKLCQTCSPLRQCIVCGKYYTYDWPTEYPYPTPRPKLDTETPKA
jgi:hypothetical protein